MSGGSDQRKLRALALRKYRPAAHYMSSLTDCSQSCGCSFGNWSTLAYLAGSAPHIWKTGSKTFCEQNSRSRRRLNSTFIKQPTGHKGFSLPTLNVYANEKYTHGQQGNISSTSKRSFDGVKRRKMPSAFTITGQTMSNSRSRCPSAQSVRCSQASRRTAPSRLCVDSRQDSVELVRSTMWI